MWESIVRIPREFSGRNARDLIDAAPDYPIYSILLYLLCVFWLPGWMAERPPFRIKYIVAAWNLTFSLLSAAGSIVILPMIREFLSAWSFYELTCVVPGHDISSLHNVINKITEMVEKGEGEEQPDYVNILHKNVNGPCAFFLALFMYAKTPELADTLFLVLQKKPVSFLHWYHHLVTALYCWHASYVVIPSGIFFAAMNYTVHAVMYLYFAGVVLGYRNLIRPFAPLITLMQVLQMFVGMGITVYIWLQYHLGPASTHTWFYQGTEYMLRKVHAAVWYTFHMINNNNNNNNNNYLEKPSFAMTDYFGGCDTNTTSMRMGLVMYGSYCILFVVLFKRLYLDAPQRKRKDVNVNIKEEKETMKVSG
ncbi:ELO family [Trypanosoma melophagium]|uniref:ELO family n=1 Tax=Trypanosoma melophagium TaxID=715481 RepID=UPI00351A9665|nr:ELO family [Trypanosoma melophagium]